MHPTLNDYLAELEPWLPAEMVAPNYMQAIKGIALTLPPVPYGCLETWLDPAINRVDLNVLVRGKTKEYEWFVGDEWPGSAMSVYDFGTQELCTRWRKPSFHLRHFIQGFWLIYDLNLAEDNTSRLWHYPELAKTILAEDEALKVEIPMQVVSSLPIELHEDLIAETRQFIAELPKAISIHCIGPNLRTANAGMRFSLVAPTLHDVCDFLTHYRWPGNLTELKKSINPIAEHIAYYGFGIDISKGLLPTVGVKVFFGNENAKERIVKVVAYLCGLGLCNQQKGDALINWCGQSEISMPRLTQASTLKRTAYLKFVFSPGGHLVVKAYHCYYTA